MAHNSTHSKDFLVGAAVGGLIGTVSALLLAPKAGRQLRDDIHETYCDIADKTHCFADNVTKKSRSLANSVGTQTSDLADRAKGLVETVTDWISPEEEEEHTARDLLIGGLIGGVLGATAGFFMAPKAGEELRHDIAETYGEVTDRAQNLANQATKKGKTVIKNVRSKATDWAEVAKDLIDSFTEQAGEKGKEALGGTQERLNEILKWASLGVRLWQGAKKKRR